MPGSHRADSGHTHRQDRVPQYRAGDTGAGGRKDDSPRQLPGGVVRQALRRRDAGGRLPRLSQAPARVPVHHGRRHPQARRGLRQAQGELPALHLPGRPVRRGPARVHHRENVQGGPPCGRRLRGALGGAQRVGVRQGGGQRRAALAAKICGDRRGPRRRRLPRRGRRRGGEEQSRQGGDRHDDRHDDHAQAGGPRPGPCRGPRRGPCRGTC